MSTIRIWAYRVLVIGAAAFMVVTFLMPWWTIKIYELALDYAVVIYPYGLESNLGEWGHFISSANMPGWFAPLMWVYLGLCVLALLFSVFIKNKDIRIWKIKSTLSSFIIGLVGFSYVCVVVLAVVVAAIRTGEFFGGVQLIGYTYVMQDVPYESGVEGRLLIGYWLACSVGPLIMLLALLRSKIIGKI